MGRYVALFIGFAVLAVVAAATAYRNFMLIEPNFAAVTAPRIDIRAPSPGILMAHELKAGDRVTRDEQLTRVKDVDLGASRLVVREGKGDRDRLTVLPSAVDEALRQSRT